MSSVEERLLRTGLRLPDPQQPVANYLGTKQSGSILHVSGRVSTCRGQVGRDVDLPSAKRAARDTLLLLLAIVKRDIGNLDRIVSVVALRGFVNSAASFVEQPQVVDGASEVLIEAYGNAGRHARTATGVSQLPYGASVQLDMTVELGSLMDSRPTSSAGIALPG